MIVQINNIRQFGQFSVAAYITECSTEAIKYQHMPRRVGDSEGLVPRITNLDARSEWPGSSQGYFTSATRII